MQHTVSAYNTATASTNKIHDDAVAQSLGFRGGLVPGVDVYAYLCHLPAEHWGRGWLERGTMTARFQSPVYDGDDVTIDATEDGAGALTLTLTDPTGTTCATARATLPDRAPPPPDVSEWPTGPPPTDPPPASEATLTAGPFGHLEATFHADRALEYLDDIRETAALFRHEGLAHPGWLLRFANWVLSANVRLGPWIHVESAAQHLGVVGDGDRVDTRAIVTGVHERGGHHFVALDVLQAVDGRPVNRVAHTAIYRPRGT